MSEFIVTFYNVGRDKATFSESVKEIEHGQLEKAVRKHLASRYLDFEVDDEKCTGSVWAGMRKVGDFSFTVKP